MERYKVIIEQTFSTAILVEAEDEEEAEEIAYEKLDSKFNYIKDLEERTEYIYSKEEWDQTYSQLKFEEC